MKSPSLDVLYSDIHKSIILTESYTEFEGLAFIIKACRLKPHDYIFQEKDNRIILHRWWFDEFGNSLKIDKKKPKIVCNDLSLDREKIVCTDLYYGLSIDKVAKISKMAHIMIGKDEDLLDDCFFLTFLGIDNYLRSFVYLQDEWQQISPLLLGLKNLKNIARDLDIKYFLSPENKENMPVPCISVQEWLTFMPPSSEFLSMLAKQQETVAHILKQ